MSVATKQAKYTPGPWRIIPAICGNGAIDIRGPVEGVCSQYIATLSGCDETEANARLIAAAPEMLEALEQICNAVDGGVYRPTQEDFDRCEAAIRKAKGEL